MSKNKVRHASDETGTHRCSGRTSGGSRIGIRRVYAVLLLIAVLSILSARSSLFYVPPAVIPVAPDSISLWCLSSEPFEPLLEYYSSVQVSEQGCLPLSITMFDSEQDLASSLDGERPDLLLCSGYRAVWMYHDGKLQNLESLSSGLFYPSAADVSECVGSVFFPLGSVADVLAVNHSLYQSAGYASALSAEDLASFISFAELANRYSGAGNGVFYTADSFSDLFCGAMYTLGELFTADADDLSRAHYRDIYNTFAENAFSGALVSYSIPAADVLTEGKTVCAFLSSSDAAVLDETVFSFYPVPVWNPSRPVIPALMTGLAVTCEDASRLAYVEEFLTGLFRDPSLIHDYAVSSGFIPALRSDEEFESGTLTNALQTIAETFSLQLPDIYGSYFANRYDYEAEFRKNMTILN